MWRDDRRVRDQIHRAARTVAASTGLALTACAGAGRSAIELGNYAAFAPRLALTEVESTTRLRVSISKPANVVVAYVVPGCEAAVVYPPSTFSATAAFAAGEEQLVPVEIGRTETSSVGSTTPRPLRRVSPLDGAERRAVQAPSRVDLGDQRPVTPPAYLLLIAAAHPLALERARMALEHRTLPANVDEALRAVSSILGGGEFDNWSGIARAVRTPWRRTCGSDPQGPIRN